MLGKHDKTGFWLDVFRAVGWGYKYFLPAIAIAWVMVEVVASQVPRVPWLAQSGLFVVCLVFYLAAAARTLGLSEENPVTMAMNRPGISIEPMLLIFFLGLLSFACFVVWLFLDSIVVDALAIGLAILVNLYVFARSWPVWGVTFFFKGKLRWSPAASASVWQGPGLNLALRVTREHGLFNIHTLRFMLGFIVLSALGFSIKWFMSDSLLFDLLIYALGIPVLSVVVMYGTQDLLGDRFVEID